MAGDHVVKQGEYVALIAKRYGFENYLTVWNHPENSDLRSKRKNNPDLIYPGDRLYIPDRELRDEQAPTDRKHVYQVNAGPLYLRVVLRDIGDEPKASLDCLVNLDGNLSRQTTDADGMIEQLIPRDAARATFTYQDSDAADKVDLPVLIGYLDPLEEVSGQIGRLNNLGYMAGDPDNPDDELYACAVEEFQCDQRLTVDGICGPATQARLKAVHGC